MKRLIVAAVLLCAILGICIAGNLVVAETGRRAQKMLSECEQACLSENRESALAAAKELGGYWKKKQTLLSAFVNHELLQQAQSSFLRLEALLSQELSSDVLAECAEAEALLLQIVSEQKLTLSGIL